MSAPYRFRNTSEELALERALQIIWGSSTFNKAAIHDLVLAVCDVSRQVDCLTPQPDNPVFPSDLTNIGVNRFVQALLRLAQDRGAPPIEPALLRGAYYTALRAAALPEAVTAIRHAGVIDGVSLPGLLDYWYTIVTSNFRAHAHKAWLLSPMTTSGALLDVFSQKDDGSPDWLDDMRAIMRVYLDEKPDVVGYAAAHPAQFDTAQQALGLCSAAEANAIYLEVAIGVRCFGMLVEIEISPKGDFTVTEHGHLPDGIRLPMEFLHPRYGEVAEELRERWLLDEMHDVLDPGHRVYFRHAGEYERVAKLTIRALRELCPKLSATLVKQALAEACGYNNARALVGENNPKARPQWSQLDEASRTQMMWRVHSALCRRLTAKPGESPLLTAPQIAEALGLESIT